MRIQKKVKFVGGRIVKTGIAVFATALICHLLDWPAMFAVITAIVTIEPTAADSIKKAFIRFPASAIGAGFSVLATFLFGDSPISYSFVAVATIIACYKLNLHAGILVATLTGIAMISTVHDEYLSSFFIRLGTTSTGLIVSSLVNLFVLPPNYAQSIHTGVHSLFQKAGDILFKSGTELLEAYTNDKELQQDFYHLKKEIEKMEMLCSYQKDEWRFHRFKRKDIEEFHYEYKKLNLLRQLTYHIGNLIFLPSQHEHLTTKKMNLVKDTFQSLKSIFYDPSFTIPQKHKDNIIEITEYFTETKPFLALESQHSDLFSETVILYELLSIHRLTEQLNEIHLLEFRRKQEEVQNPI